MTTGTAESSDFPLGTWSSGQTAPMGVVVGRDTELVALLSCADRLAKSGPATATVLLASLVLGERIHRTQAAGLALCAGSVVCVALG